MRGYTLIFFTVFAKTAIWGRTRSLRKLGCRNPLNTHCLTYFTASRRAASGPKPRPTPNARPPTRRRFKAKTAASAKAKANTVAGTKAKTAAETRPTSQQEPKLRRRSQPKPRPWLKLRPRPWLKPRARPWLKPMPRPWLKPKPRPWLKPRLFLRDQSATTKLCDPNKKGNGGPHPPCIPLPRGIRNNNPGNLKYSSNAWNGKLPLDPSIDAVYERFDTPHNGIRALARDMQTKINRGLDTVKKIIEEYAPPQENNTAAYIEHVAQVVTDGDENKPLTADKQTLQELAKTIIKHENGTKPNGDPFYTDSEISAAVDDAMKN